MSAGIELYNNVLNQLGSPALYSDIFANRPAFGFTGRLFISTDTLEIYRDTGTAWQLLSSGGGGTNIYNSNGTLTANRTLTNGGFSLTFTGAASSFVFNLDANTNVSRQLNFTTGSVKRWSTEITDNETGANAGSNYYLRSFQDGGTSLLDVLSITRSTGVVSHNSNAVLSTAIDNLTGIYNVNRGTYTAAAYTGGNPQNAIYNIFTHDARINQTYGNGQYIAAAANVWRFEPTDGYTITLTQATGVRTMGAALYTTQYNIPAGKTETVSHLSGITLLGIYDLFTGGRGTLAVTNAYGLVINDLNEYAYGTLTLTNRWGIYQGGASDSNYFNGNTLIGSTTSTGEKLQVTGTARVTQSAYFATASGNVGIGTATPFSSASFTGLTVNGNGPGILPIIQLWINGSARAQFYHDGATFITGTTTATAYNFGTNNVERMRITATGDVGIGTATPNGIFNVYDANASIRASSPLGPNIRLYAGTVAILETATNDDLIFRTNSTDRGRIKNNGNWLIGKSSDDGALLQIGDAGNISFGTTTGTKIGTSTSQKLAFYNKTPIVQPTTAVGSATYAAGGGAGSIIKTDDTIGGYTMLQVVQALQNLGILA